MNSRHEKIFEEYFFLDLQIVIIFPVVQEYSLSRDRDICPAGTLICSLVLTIYRM